MAGNETPSWARVIADAIEARAANLHTAMPALVESYDDATCMVSVSPCLKRTYFASGEVVDLPVIKNVPVVFPRGGSAAITFELQKGDVVLLVFAERSVDTWKTVGGKVDPKDARKHALSDAFAIPGGYPKISPVATSLVTAAFTADGAFKVENKAGGLLQIDKTGVVSFKSTATGLAVEISPAGTWSIKNAAGIDFIAQLLATLDKFVQTTKVATAMGLQPFIPDPTYLLERAKLDAFKA